MITKEEAKEMIFKTEGKIFGVSFIKKDGTFRAMNCRRGVKKGVKGVGMGYDPAKFNLIPVYDMNNGFRMINASTIQDITIKGDKYEVAQ